MENDIELLEFAEWVAEWIFDQYFEMEAGAFAELACRKLCKLGIVQKVGDKWVYIAKEESDMS